MQKLSFVLSILLLNISLVSSTYVPRAAPFSQFITGPCTGDIDCASGCCGFKSGKCAGAIVAQERDGGCGFGDAQPNDRAAQAVRNGQDPRSAVLETPVGTQAAATTQAASTATATSTGSGKPPGTQFITGPCGSDADCASGCCGFKSGLCAGPVVAQERDGGCGFGNPQPNSSAAQAFRSGQNAAASPTAAPPAVTTTQAQSAPTTPAGSSGRTPFSQFITGACSGDIDCASGCCGFKSGKCAGAIVAQERDGGCGFGDAQPNDRAAQAVRNGQDPRSAVLETPVGTQAAASTQAASTATATSTSTGSGKPPGTQFITGPCGSDADCASGCCGFKSGLCAGPVVAQERDGGCGFGDAQPNDNAARKIRGQRRK